MLSLASFTKLVGPEQRFVQVSSVFGFEGCIRDSVIHYTFESLSVFDRETEWRENLHLLFPFDINHRCGMRRFFSFFFMARED